MKGDFTRDTFRRFKDYSSVRMQQGRVQLDSDWNEQAEIELQREGALLSDLMGQGGIPRRGSVDRVGDSEFTIAYDQPITGNRLVIGASIFAMAGKYVGRAYVDSRLVEQEYPTLDVTIDHADIGSLTWTVHVPTLSLPDGRQLQVGTIIMLDRADFKLPFDKRRVALFTSVITAIAGGNTLTIKADPFSTQAWAQTAARLFGLYSYDNQPYYPSAPALPTTGQYLAYLDVWCRHITPVEDPPLREAALGGPDTATRTQTIWQVKLLSITDPATVDDGSWMDAVAPKLPGTLKARYNPAPGQAQALENRLYRVEIHQGGTPSMTTVTFKWSRDNGSQAAPWISGSTQLNVATQGRDEALGFAKDQWIELTDDVADLLNHPGSFVQISAPPDPTNNGQLLTVTVPAGADSTYAHYSGHPKVRRWDSSSGASYPPAVTTAWIALENGIEVQFDTSATYQTGDYWLIPARPSESGIEWPQDAVPLPIPLPARRAEHGYLALSLIDFGTTPPTLTDKRRLFTEIPKLSSQVKQLSAAVPGAVSVFPAIQAYFDTLGTAVPLGWKPTFDGLGVYAKCTSAANGVIPIQLPHRAQLSQLQARWRCDAIDLWVILYANDLVFGSTITIDTVYTSSTGGTVITTSAAASHNVDNTKYVYYLKVYASGTSYIYGLVINYNLVQAVLT